jgi:PAS domain S-box-containing protein
VGRRPHVRQSEAELEAFFDLSIDLLSIIGFDGRFKRVNRSFERLLGYPMSELFSRSALEILHPDDVEAAREALAQLAAGHDRVGFEARVVCADGSVRWLEWNTRTMPERGVVYSVGRDTTERRRAEAELREAQRKAERIFEMSPALLGVAGFDGYLRRFNPAFEVFGYSREELLSRPWIEFAHLDDRELMQQAIASLDRGDDVVRLQNRVICRDGSLRWVEWSTRVVPEEGLFYAAGRDVTDSRRAAEEQSALRRVATLVARESPPEAVFAAVGREVGEVLGVDATHLGRFDGDGTVVSVAQWGRNTGVPIGARYPLEGDSASARVLRTGRPARMDSYEDAPGVIAATLRKLGIRSSIAVPISVEGRPWGVMIATSKSADPFPAETESRLQDFTELVATAISNATARGKVRVLAEEQAALRQVATLVARGVPPAEVFEAIAREGGRLLGVDAMHMGRYEDRAAISVAGWSVAGDHMPVGTRVELDGTNVASLVFQSGRPARIDGYSPPTGGTAGRLRHEMSVYSSVATPIVVDGRLWGLMIASSKHAQSLPADTESRLLGFTELAETAISNSEARAELAASRARLVAAADEERRRVVRDLHDGAQQRLVHSIVTLKLAERELRDHDGRATALVREALAHAESATAEVRELARGIMPNILTHGGLRAGVEALASRMMVPVVVDVSPQRLSPPIEATAYFVVAEALTNVAKHARAQQATVTASVDDGALRVEVRDDGVGGAEPEGSGLLGLSDRVATLNGTFTVDSLCGGGTVVRATIPLPAD